MLVSEVVQKAAPTGAKFYRLQMKFSDGSSRYYPDKEAFVVGQAALGTPPGRYLVCYYDADGQSLPLEESLIVDLKFESQRSSTAQMGLSLSNAAGPSSPPRASLPGAAPAVERAASELTEAERHALLARLSAGQAAQHLSPEAELEFRRYQQALDLEERQQEFIKNSTYVTEIGEVFGLNRIMRREMMEMQRVIVQQSQQSYKDLELMKTTLRDLFKLQQEALDRAAEMIPKPPPPPPPDYVGLGHTAINAFKEFGIAVLDKQRSRSSERDAIRGLYKALQLPPPASLDASDAKEAKEAPNPKEGKEGSSPPSDIIGKLVRRVKASSDLELALAMSSPDKIKAFMDELLTQPTPPSEKSDASTSSAPAPAQKPDEAPEKKESA